MNQVILIGRLTRDPEIRYTNDGKAVASWSLAVDRMGEGADFIRCTAFGRAAENAEKYLFKGKKIALQGRWQTGSFEKDGRTVYTNDCIVNFWEFVEAKGTNDTTAGEPGPADFVPVPDSIDEDLPFN